MPPPGPDDQAAGPVVQEADNIEALPRRAPTLVLELLKDGASPCDAVCGLEGHPLVVAEVALAENLIRPGGTLCEGAQVPSLASRLSALVEPASFAAR